MHKRNGNNFQDSIVFACPSRPITQMYLDELVAYPVNAKEGVSRRLGQVKIPWSVSGTCSLHHKNIACCPPSFELCRSFCWSVTVCSGARLWGIYNFNIYSHAFIGKADLHLFSWKERSAKRNV